MSRPAGVSSEELFRITWQDVKKFGKRIPVLATLLSGAHFFSTMTQGEVKLRDPHTVPEMLTHLLMPTRGPYHQLR